MHMVEKNLYAGGKKRALTLSYDDGSAHDRRLVAILDRYGIRGSFHLNSGCLGNGANIAKEEVRMLYANHEVSCHTVTHPQIALCPRATMVREILDDRRALEELVGYCVRGFSYPYGSFSDEVVSVMETLGIVYGRTVLTEESYAPPADPMRWKPTCHHENALRCIEPFKRALHPLPLLYVWGHSCEFDGRGNWDLIEMFCAEAGGLDDVWYATSLEIVDYLDALKRVVSSVDGSCIQNPSGIPVWLTVDGNTVEIAAGGVYHS